MLKRAKAEPTAAQEHLIQRLTAYGQQAEVIYPCELAVGRDLAELGRVVSRPR